MTKEELVARLRDIEWDDFEVKAAKSELPKNILETVSAFSNTSGGWIVLGVKQSGKTFEIQGVDNIEKLEQGFLGTLRSGKFNQTIFARPKRYDIDACKVLAFYIPEIEMKPVYYGNPTIAKLFRYVGIAENAGYGMNKLFSWETLTGTRPTIESDRTIATVTFPLKSAIQRLNVSDAPVNVPVKLTDTQQKVLELIKSNPSITHLEMSQRLSINEKTAKRATQALRELDLIKREGSDKTGQWVLFYKN